jgi:hypothetical protein
VKGAVGVAEHHVPSARAARSDHVFGSIVTGAAWTTYSADMWDITRSLTKPTTHLQSEMQANTDVGNVVLEELPVWRRSPVDL